MTNDPADLPDHVATADGERLRVAWSVGETTRCVAILTHPHPLYGGDMDNIVPAALARTLPDHGISTIRFDFRGAGGSTGTHGGGVDEIADVAAAIDAAASTFPGMPVIGVGYSFGADVLLAVEDERLTAVVAVAPPLAVLPDERLAAARGAAPTLILSPAHDQFRPAAEAVSATEGWADTSVIEVPGADHFMAGATAFVAEQVVGFVERVATD